MTASSSRWSSTVLTPFERFLHFGKARDTANPQFPPPHWTQTAENPPSQVDTRAMARDTSMDGRPRPASLETSLIEREELDGDSVDASEHDAAAPVQTTEAPNSDTDDEPAPEPSYLARKIQALLATLPTLPTSPTPTAETLANVDHQSAQPEKPALPSWIADSRLVSYLSSPQVMNGSAANGRPSVWNMLDHLKSTTGLFNRPSSAAPDSKGKAPATPQGQRDGGDSMVNDRASVMLYAPLVPDDSSEVEVACSEVISLADDQTTIHEREEPTAEEPKTLRKRLAGMMPSDGMRIGGHQLPVASGQQKERRVWVPSKDKISLEIRWWGYRIYLPPPILAVMDNKRLESTKRAALLTTALKYLLDHIPMAAVPLQMRPAMPLLKRIIPYMGYIGAFVAWSWDAIRAFDKGNGVVLTATWLLTFALVPGTWEDGMFPEVNSPASKETPAEPSNEKNQTS